MNPSPWFSNPWLSWFFTIILASTAAGLLVPALKSIIVACWRATLHRPFWLLVAALKAGKLPWGHWSGSYFIHTDVGVFAGSASRSRRARPRRVGECEA